MPYIENEILERLITTMVEGFARVGSGVTCFILP